MRRSHSGPPISASFVSSVMAGYEHYRAAAIEGIEAVGATPVAFERFGGRDSDPEAAYLAEVSTRRFTWACSARATASRCPTLFGDPRRVQPCRAGRPAALDMGRGACRSRGAAAVVLRGRARVRRDRQLLEPGGLEDRSRRRLRGVAAEDLSPWCKLGPVVFPAREITESRDGVVEATVRDPGVAEALQAMNDPFARGGASSRIRVAAGRRRSATFRRTTRAARTRDFRISLAVEPPSAPQRYTLNGISWEEMTDLAIRVSIMGESNPLGLMASEARSRTRSPCSRRPACPRRRSDRLRESSSPRSW